MKINLPEALHQHSWDLFLSILNVHNYKAYPHSPEVGDKTRAIGTDGKRAITKAIEALDFILLWCYLHMKENIRWKLTDLLFSECIRKEILHTQQGSVYVKGILDSEDVDDFYRRFLLLKNKWDDLKFSVHPQSEPDFHTWVLQNESSVERFFCSPESWIGLSSCKNTPQTKMMRV